MNRKQSSAYPFSAIVDQKQMKKALLLNAVNPKIGGVLVRGEKGTAKSIAVRALAQLLPEIEIVADCPFGCDPHSEDALCDSCAERMLRGQTLESGIKQVSVVQLPIGATEDRVTGTLDIEKAIQTGQKHFEPGLLAVANRGILYVDEVNLLDDHIVDVLLDAAAMGVNFVEREGISFSHPAAFILVGTMNPEEGELRPQLLDRFGLAVEVKGVADQKARAQIVRRRLAFEDDAVAFADQWESEQGKLRRQIIQAKQLLPEVELDDSMLDLTTHICIDFAVDGHRADIVMHKAALTLAAFNGRKKVNTDDVRQAAELSLLHRRRRQPFDTAMMDHNHLEKSLKSWENKRQKEAEATGQSTETDPREDADEDNLQTVARGSLPDGLVYEADATYKVKAITTPLLDQLHRDKSGRRFTTRSVNRNGRYVGSEIPKDKVTDLAFDATLRAASPYQIGRRNGHNHQGLLLAKHDLRQKVREMKSGNLILFLLDASGSMEREMSATKAAILSLLLDAYQRRDHVGLITFGGDGANLVLPPTNSVELAQKLIRRLPSGGRSPLVHGLKLGLKTMTDYTRRNRGFVPLLVLVSDGKGNVSLKGDDPMEEARSAARQIGKAHIHSICIDTEETRKLEGRMEDLSRQMGGLYLRPEELKADAITSAVKERLVCWR